MSAPNSNLLLRDLTDNAKLISLLDKIELVLGYKITAQPMPKEQQSVAECGIEFRGNKWSLLYIEGAAVSEDSICHELMHLALLIASFPTFVSQYEWDYHNIQDQILSFISNLSPHIKVWELTEKYGFSESSRCENGMSTELIPMLKGKKFSRVSIPRLVKVQDSLYLANGFLCPCEETTKNTLREIAKENYPQALELADSICRAYKKALPLTPKLMCDATLEVLELIECPKELLRPCFYPVRRQGFLEAIFDKKE